MILKACCALLALCGLPAGMAAVIDQHPTSAAGPLSKPWMRKGAEANLPETVSRRARLVVAYCGQCHSPPPPALHSGDEWRWMIVRMDMRAWSSQRATVRIASNAELKDIARYYGDHAGR
jgi:hypothetical protein